MRPQVQTWTKSGLKFAAPDEAFNARSTYARRPLSAVHLTAQSLALSFARDSAVFVSVGRR